MRATGGGSGHRPSGPDGTAAGRSLRNWEREREQNRDGSDGRRRRLTGCDGGSDYSTEEDSVCVPHRTCSVTGWVVFGLGRLSDRETKDDRHRTAAARRPSVAPCRAAAPLERRARRSPLFSRYRRLYFGLRNEGGGSSPDATSIRPSRLWR